MGKNGARRKSESNGANLGFEAKLWLTADKLRNNMDAAEYKPGESSIQNQKSRIENHSDVPGFCKSAKSAEIADQGYVLTPGRCVGGEAAALIVPQAAGRSKSSKPNCPATPRRCSRRNVGDAPMLGGFDNRRRCVVPMLVEMLAPYKGRVYDPCCGSAGMFVQSEKFVEEHGGRMTPPTSAWRHRWSSRVMRTIYLSLIRQIDRCNAKLWPKSGPICSAGFIICIDDNIILVH